MNEIEKTLKERGNTHGRYSMNCLISQQLKATLKEGDSYKELSIGQHESLDFIAQKIARIVNGDVSELDHWRDIAGYATLTMELMSEPEEVTDIEPPPPIEKKYNRVEDFIIKNTHEFYNLDFVIVRALYRAMNNTPLGPKISSEMVDSGLFDMGMYRVGNRYSNILGTHLTYYSSKKGGYGDVQDRLDKYAATLV